LKEKRVIILGAEVGSRLAKKGSPASVHGSVRRGVGLPDLDLHCGTGSLAGSGSLVLLRKTWGKYYTIIGPELLVKQEDL
jgi:hypothetical protein